MHALMRNLAVLGRGAHNVQAVADRDEMGAQCIKRYCTVEEWDAYVARYELLNEACGRLQVTGADLVLRITHLLPRDLPFRSAPIWHQRPLPTTRSAPSPFSGR